MWIAGSGLTHVLDRPRRGGGCAHAKGWSHAPAAATLAELHPVLQRAMGVVDDGGLALMDLAGLHRLLHRNPLGARDYAYAVDLVRARLGLDPEPPDRLYSARE